MKYHSILSVLSIAAILGSVSQANAGLVNGSFETGDYTGWIFDHSVGVNQPGSTWGIASTGQIINPGDSTKDFFSGSNVQQTSEGLPITYYPNDGNYLAYLFQTEPVMLHMYQDVTLDSDPKNLSWWMSYNNHQGSFIPYSQSLILQVIDLSAIPLSTLTAFTTDNLGANESSIPMTQFNADISSFAGRTIRLDITMWAENYYFDAAFDNFQLIKPVPEPTTFALMGLGLAGLQFRRRKICASV